MNIITNPVGLEHSESLDKLTFSCVSRANPAPSYSWKLPNGTEVDGQIFHLYNLQINDTGTYTCIARNEIPDANSTATKEVTINIGEYFFMTPKPTKRWCGEYFFYRNFQTVDCGCEGHLAPAL